MRVPPNARVTPPFQEKKRGKSSLLAIESSKTSEALLKSRNAQTEVRLSDFGQARLHTSLEELTQARLVKIAHRRFAAWLNPFGMLLSQVVVNLMLKLGHGVDRVTD
jgi:hypothetical protein